jgi:hypothetical protein
MHARIGRGRLPLAGILLVMAAGLAGSAQAETPEFDAALKRAAETGQPLVLDFYTDW